MWKVQQWNKQKNAILKKLYNYKKQKTKNKNVNSWSCLTICKCHIKPNQINYKEKTILKNIDFENFSEIFFSVNCQSHL